MKMANIRFDDTEDPADPSQIFISVMIDWNYSIMSDEFAQ
jgi:hypothetical protein